jgi:hypothetical protein
MSIYIDNTSKKLVIDCRCSVIARLDARQRRGAQGPLAVADILTPKVESCIVQAKHANHISAHPEHQSQYLILRSNFKGDEGPVCAIFRSESQKHYISARIVQRFNLGSHNDPTANTSTIVAGERSITPTRNYITLVATIGQGNNESSHRFFIVEHPLQNFDILIGSDIITNLPASVKDKPIGSIRPIRSKA